MTPDHCYRLADGVAVRRERFGGLVYHYHTRRLYFLHSHALTDFVGTLSGAGPVGEAMRDFRLCRGLSAESEAAMLKSLAALETMGLLVPVAA